MSLGYTGKILLCLFRSVAPEMREIKKNIQELLSHHCCGIIEYEGITSPSSFVQEK